MNDKRKTKDQLIKELVECRRRIEELSGSIARFGPSEDVFALMGNSMQVGIYIIQNDKTIFTNSHISSYSGYSPDELGRLSLMNNTVHPEDRQRVRECGIRMLKGLDATPYEYRIIARDGSIRWLMEKVTSIIYRGRKAVLGNTMDITDRIRMEDELLEMKNNLERIVAERTNELLEANASLEAEVSRRKQATEALRDSEDIFRALAENSLDTIMRFDLECRHIYVNPNAEKETGIAREKFIGRTHKELGFPEDLSMLWEKAIEKVIKTKSPNRIEFRLPSGIWIDWFLVPELDESGGVKAVMTSSRDITDRKMAEQALKESEEGFRLLFEKSADASLLLQNGRYIDCNDAAVRMAGAAAKADVLNLRPEDILPERQPDGALSSEKVRKLMAAALEKGTTRFEWVRRRFDGRDIHLDVMMTAIPVKGEKLLFTTWRDITDRKLTEKALQDAEKRFLQVTENAGELIWEVDAQGMYRYCSPSAKRILGYAPAELVGKKHFYDLFTPDTREETKEEVFAQFRRREPFRNFVNRNLHKNGNIVILETSGTPLLDNDGNLLGYRGTDMDITERRLVAEALQESERKYRLITEKMSDIVWIADLNLKTAYITPSVYNVLGHSQEEIAALSPNELMTPESWSVALDTFARELALEAQGLADPDRTVKLELDYYHRDGSTRCLETVISAIRNEQGVMTELHGVSRDITERKRTEEKLKETMDIFGEAQRIAHIGSWEWDIKQNKIWYSDELRRIFEISRPERPISLPAIFNSIKPDYRLKVEKAIEEAIEKRKPFNVEYAIAARNQPERVLQSQGKAFYDAEGKAVRIVGITKDITQEKILERQLIHREKLASLGLMISGIAHEVNNSNNFIVFNIPILRDYVRELLNIASDYAEGHPDYSLFGMSYPEFKTDIIKLIDNLDHGAHRINNTISHLRDFTSRKVQHKKEVDVAEAIDNAEKVCQNQIAVSVKRFEKHVEPDIPKILTDGDALEQIIVNLLINAVHALDKEQSEIRINARKGKTWHERVIIEVTDNGSGIEPKAINNVFDPFFTTKPFNKGMGLGLYMVKNMLEGLGGRIEVASEPGKGSTFRIILADMDIQ